MDRVITPAPDERQTVAPIESAASRPRVRCDAVIPYDPANLPFLPAAIQSTLNQQHADVVVHAVNDGFDDTLDAHIRRDFGDVDNVRLYRNPKPVGPYVTTNRLFDHLVTDFVLIHDSDDLAAPYRAWRSVTALEQTGADVFGGAMEQFVDESADGEYRRELLERAEKRPVLFSGERWPLAPLGAIVNGAMTVRRDAFFRLGGFADWFTDADLEFATRLLAAGYRVHVSDQVTGRRRMHVESLSHRPDAALQQRRDEYHAEMRRRYAHWRCNGFDPREYGTLDRDRTDGKLTLLTPRSQGVARPGRSQGVARPTCWPCSKGDDCENTTACQQAVPHHRRPGVTVGRRVTIHPTANVYSSTIGDDTKIAAYAEIGGTSIGARCKVQAHAFIPPGVTIGNEVFIGPGAIFTNDKYPRAVGHWQRLETTVRYGASIGAGAIIGPGLVIGEHATVGAGAVVVQDVPAWDTVAGNPAASIDTGGDVLMILQPRAIPEAISSLRGLAIDKAWFRAFDEPAVVAAVNDFVQQTRYTNYLIVADDVVVDQSALDCVREMLQRHEAATGYCHLAAGDERVNLTRSPVRMANGNHATWTDYDFLTIDEVRRHRGEFASGFGGWALSGMRRRLWLRYPMRVNGSTKAQSDHDTSLRMGRDGLEWWTHPAAYIHHLKEDANVSLQRDWIVDREPAVVIRDAHSPRPRLTIVIPIWQRWELTLEVLSHYRDVSQQLADTIDVRVLAVGSEGEVSRGVAESAGVDYFEADNEPLWQKYDAGFLEARREAPDAVALVGSNDVFDAVCFSRAMSAIVAGVARPTCWPCPTETKDHCLPASSATRPGADLVGLVDCYLVDQATGDAWYWPGYLPGSDRHGETIAAGRVYGRDLLDKIGWRPYQNAQRTQDASGWSLNDDQASNDLAKQHGAKIVAWRMDEIGTVYQNIKSDHDMNPLAAFQRAYGDALRKVEGGARALVG